MSTEKRFFQLVLLFLIGAMTVYTLLLRSAMYNEDGLPRLESSALRVIGEDAAGDFAAFRLLESSPADAYDSAVQTAYLRNKMQSRGTFAAFASPVKAFIAVPFLPLPYTGYFDTVFFWGFFLFGVALYALFPLRISVLLLAALPAAFLNFAFGGFGLYVAACAVLSLMLAENCPKRAGFFGGLLAAEPLMFALVLFAFAFRKQKKALMTAALVGGFLLIAAGMRYGFAAYGAAVSAAFQALKAAPCRFVSPAGILLCGGASPFVAILFQTVCVLYVFSIGYKLFFKYRFKSEAVQNAFLCAASVLLTPVATAGDGALLSAAVAFLLFDSEHRGYLKADLPLFVLAFGAIFFDGMLAAAVGMSAQTAIAVLLPLACRRRAY